MLAKSEVNGKPVRDNAVVWLLTQCLPLDPIKKILKDDLAKKNGNQYGFLISTLMSFYNKDQATTAAIYHDIRDTAMTCFVREQFMWFSYIYSYSVCIMLLERLVRK
jgi:hypothetical protein